MRKYEHKLSKHSFLQKRDQQLVYIAAAKPLNKIEWMTTQNDQRNEAYKKSN
jgi:hypothetical protein